MIRSTRITGLLLAGLLLLLSVCLPRAAFASTPADRFGTLQNAEGAAVADTWLSVRDASTQKEYSLWVNHEGRFELSPDMGAGVYETVKYWDGSKKTNVFLRQSFTIHEDGSLEPSPLVLNALSDNVTGIVSRSGGETVSGWVNIVGEDGASYDVFADDQGRFGLNLPQGSYSVRGFEDSAGKERSALRIGFEVGSGGASVSVALPSPNVAGTLAEGDKPVDGVQLQLYNVSSGDNYSVNVNDGSFSLSLPNGNYLINGYWLNGSDQFVTLSQSFKVNGQTTVQVVVPAKNVTGTVKRGDSPLAGIWLQIRTSDYTRTYSARTSSSGEYGLSLPNGSYVIDGYYDNESGGYVRLTQPMDALKGTAVWNVDVPVPNVNGTLQKSDGNPVDGITLTFQKTEGERNSYSTQVVAGKFSLYLPDGQYFASGYWDPATRESVQLNHLLTVENGKLVDGANIAVPVKNVTGTLSKENGQAIGDVWLEVRNLSQTSVFRTYVGSDGSFSLALPDGDYKVFSYYSADYQTNVRLFQTFSVKGETNWKVIEQTLNVKGTLEPVDGVNLPEHLNFSVQQVLENSLEGFQIQVTNGQFETSLADGHYLIRGYSYEGDEGLVNETFFGSFDVEGTTDLTIPVPKANVAGTVKQGDKPLAYGTVDFYNEAEPNQLLSMQVSNGVFSASLPEGNYTVLHVFDVMMQKYYASGMKFSVSGGEPIELPIVLNELNVTGTVRYEDGSIPRNISFSVMEDGPDQGDASWQQIDLVDGEFQTYLADGAYVVKAYYDTVNRTSINLSEPIRFEVSGKTNVTMTLPLPNVTGVVYQANGVDKLTSVSVSIQDVNHEGAPSYGAWTGPLGIFSLKLPDGSYKITHVYGNDQTSWNADVSFQVQNGAMVAPDGQMLAVVVQENNVSGSVTLPDGSIVPDPLDITVNETASGEMFHLHASGGSFQGYLPDGHYVVHVIWNGSTESVEQLADAAFAFEVTGGKSNPETIVIPILSKNWSGQLVYADGQPASGGYVELQRLVTTDHGYTMTESTYSVSSQGQFGASLTKGTYLLVSYIAQDGVSYLLGGSSFEIGDDPVALPAINLPAPNVHGLMQDAGGAPAPDGVMRVAAADSGTSGWNLGTNITVKSGAFDAYLPDGDYVILAYHVNSTNENITLATNFTVAGDQAGGEGLQITLPSFSKVQGEVLYDEGDQPAQLTFVRTDDDGSQETFHVMVEGGHYQATLPYGSYTMPYWLSSSGDHSYESHSLASPVQIELAEPDVSADIDLRTPVHE